MPPGTELLSLHKYADEDTSTTIATVGSSGIADSVRLDGINKADVDQSTSLMNHAESENTC